MQRKSFFYIALLAISAVSFVTSCKPRDLTEEDVFTNADDIDALIRQTDAEYRIYNLNDFVDTYMTEQGNFWSDTSQYRTRATNGDGVYLFSIDTIPTNTHGIYIRGRISTDDYGGNFYKSLIIQQIVDGKQQNLRISADLGSAGGLYQIGQEILIRCNGLCVGRYGDQPQLCVAAYNNNIYASNASQKIGWAPGRIPSSIFRNITTLIGHPDQSLLQYDTIQIADFINIYREINDANKFEKERQMRMMDGSLVVLKDVWFTGQYSSTSGDLINCTTGDPEEDQNANVFAPTTGNVGFPQSRIITDGTNRTLVSNSEYSKFSHFYIPGADSTGVANCPNYRGTITGVLGQFRDNAGYSRDQYDWSITPRNINIGNRNPINDIIMYHIETGAAWVPQEYKANNTAAE